MADEVGSVAEAAGVRTLVLSHLVPAAAPSSRWLEAVTGFSGDLIVGEDLLEIPLVRPGVSARSGHHDRDISALS